MKLLLVILGLSAVFAENIVPHTAYDYHRNIGVRQASRIRAAENALDFDGSRIAGGSVSNLGQFPFLGGLVISLNSGATSVCGSSLVSNTHAVTAAHCWFDGTNQAIQFTVVLGSVRLFADGTRIDTRNVLLHPSYNFQNANNDVALITIDRVTFSNTINRINLATGSNQFVGTWARAAGFGRTGDDVGISTAQVLSHVEVQVISNAECRQTFGNNILSSSICTSGANGRSPCGGDDGGPLQVGNTLIGIFSFVSGQGCTHGFPAVYARATSFASWVHARIR